MREEIIKHSIQEYSTPFYLFDVDEAKQRINYIRESLQGIAKVCFAIKANPFLMKSVRDCVDKFEVCSPGEFHIYEEQEMLGEQLIYSGVYKDKDTLESALSHYNEEGIFTVESELHWQLIEEWANSNCKKVKVYLRLTSGNQFGMDEGVVERLVRERKTHPYMEIEGIHFFSGTQKKKLIRQEKELQYLNEYCHRLKDKYDFMVKNLEYGPGAPISYFQEEKNVMTTDEFLDGIIHLISEMDCGAIVTLEMGRFLMAMCGSYVTSVCDLKHNKGTNYIIVDGGIHHLNYDGQLKGMYLPFMKIFRTKTENFEKVQPISSKEGQNKKATLWDICGALCTINDVIVSQVPMECVCKGDIFVFERVGAYSIYEGMVLFLSRTLPEVVFYSKDHGFQSVRKPIETYKMNRPNE